MTAIKFSGTFHSLCAFLLLFACSVPTSAQQQESLTYDPQTGKYTMYYYSDDEPGKLERSVFELPNKIDPTIKSKVKETDKGTITYHYKVRNGKESTQNFEGMRLLASHAYEPSQSVPNGWHGSIIPRVVRPEYNIGWSYWSNDPGAGLKPGQSQSGFGYESHDLPGIGVIEAWGAVMPSPREDYTGNMDPHADTEIGKQYWKLLETSNYVRRYVSLPKIVVPTPFDAAIVLAGIQKHIKDDLIGMNLIDPVFAAQLDRGLQFALDAAKRGNTAGLKGQLKDLRNLLKGFGEPEEEDHSAKKKNDEEIPEDQIKTKDWPHPIAKLAARVLDFDLKYVESRLSAP